MLRRRGRKFRVWERGWLDARFRIVLDSLRASTGGSPEQWKIWTENYEGLLSRAPKNRLVARSVGSFCFYRAFGVPYTCPESRMYWEKALKYFQQNAYEAGGDPFVLRDMALTHKYLAGLAGMDHKQRIGHATEAVRLDRMDLAYSINAVAAQPGYLEGFLIRKGLAISDPNNAFVLRSLLYPIRFYGVVPARLQDWLRVVRG